MYKTKGELIADFDEVDNRLAWREDKGILRDGERVLIEMANLLRPFLEVLTDIRDWLATDFEEEASQYCRDQGWKEPE